MLGRAWRYVTLDVTGTLIRPAEATGETYLRFWEAVSGQTFSPSRRAALATDLTARFPVEYNLQSQRQHNFEADGVFTRSFPWWRDLVLNIMKEADVAVQPENSERFTRELYAHFCRPEAWPVFPDVRPALDKLQTAGVRMGHRRS
ncbi:Haloacid dehalogenase-like hydrolase domain-containing protein 3 [Phytophthora citrophthora]|uniref:Haloacid dehalogenase-like hydrolase domain-containing protein 3 n=1 Tax=Phytophthora citrophthora TaxID=4793 RepID=A0AAD9LDB2_9STRA|nr:Haloacid dehalogenase-like hydrolase domain-containing protein 3 [Phytophthora citrophthora]